MLGAFALYATDDFFAEKENLLKPRPAVWIEDKYTDKGKWMDGWESQRTPRARPRLLHHSPRRCPGACAGALVDTTHFKGNAPAGGRARGHRAPRTPRPPRAPRGRPAGVELFRRPPCKPDFPNVFALDAASDRVTHVRLRIYPDGGVARLRVYGDVDPGRRARSGARAAWISPRSRTAARVAAVSDQFFGPPSNLLLPGRGVNMGDGWETKRRRTPGQRLGGAAARRAAASRAHRARHALLQGQRAAGHA